MTAVIVHGQWVAGWICAATGGCVTPHTQAIGEMRGGALIAAISVEGWNGVNAIVHQRIEAAPSRRFWRACARYFFERMGCRRVTGFVDAANLKARRLDEHIGFEHEATLKGAGQDGGDVMVYVLWRERCRMLGW